MHGEEQCVVDPPAKEPRRKLFAGYGVLMFATEDLGI